jgi:hypothetical protein
MKTAILVLSFMLFASSTVTATWQFPDLLIHKGETYEIYADLLETYFKKFPDRKPVTEGRCSALWRGYVATFEISNDRLTLKDVTSDNCSSPKPALKTVVPDSKPLHIDWFTGLLLSANGSNEGNSYSIEFVDSFKKYSLFEIDAGILRRERHFLNKEYQKFKKRQFAAFKKTPEYQETVKKMTAKEPPTEEVIDANILQWFFWSPYTKKILVD